MVSLVLCLLQTAEAQLRQLVFVGEALQPSDHPCGRALASHQNLAIFPEPGAPNLDALPQTGCHAGRAERGWGTVTSLSVLATPLDADQCAVGLGGCGCKLLAHVKFFV